MKIRLSYSNDGIGAGVALANLPNHIGQRDAADQTMKKFVKWDGVHETIVVEFDHIAGTATVIPLEED